VYTARPFPAPWAVGRRCLSARRHRLRVIADTTASSLAAAQPPGKPAVTRAPDRASPGSATSSHHIPSLDGIRAGSFLIVFGSNTLSASWIPGPFGVTVFLI
jgi:hypothetical protein